MLNKVILKGNLGADPEFKKTQSGQDVAFFSLATSFSWKRSDGEWNKHVDWHRITVFKDSTLRWMKGILKKGDTVYVEGELQYRTSKDKVGKTHTEAQIIVSEKFGCIEHIRRNPPNPFPQNQNLENTFKSYPKEGSIL